jgi:LCP family protein required for cell wall assembly
VVLVLVLLVAMVFGGSWLYLRYRFGKIPSVNVTAEAAVVSGQPVNFLVIGSDSRAGLTGAMAAQAGSVAMVQGQRSDVVQIWHVDPKAGTIALLSIPRDTMVSMGSLSSTVGRFNRINTAYGEGPNPLVSLIENNFGIPINHVLQVRFSGFVGATDSLGGVWMNFPYPARDAYSGLSITSPGCQLLTGTQALAVARSRHYEYDADGRWLYDGTSDFGRIQRQGAFLRALIDSAKSKYNPLTINAFLAAIPEGITKDSNLGFNELLGLALRYHSIDPNSLVTQTLPTTSVGYVSPWGDVLFVDQPAAQQMITAIFGSQLTAPRTPPPNPSLQTPQPPAVTTTTTSPPASKQASSSGAVPTPTTTPPPSFDPTPCAPH